MGFINPKTDFAFKKIFGSEDSKDILISFLNALIYDSNPTIEDLEILDPALAGNLPGLKDTYLDVKAKLNDGTLVIIEMQVLNVEYFDRRVFYNAAKAYSNQLQAGEGYFCLKPVIALTITDFIMFEESDDFISHFVFQEKSKNFTYIADEFSLVFVELPKFKKVLENLETLTDKWLYFMKRAIELDSVPGTMGNIPELQKAFQIANKANLNRKDLENLERQELFLRDQQGIARYAQNEGREEGRQEGREEGLQEGRQEGRQEAQLEIARQLLDVLDDETIASKTQLSVEAVRNLRSQN